MKLILARMHSHYAPSHDTLFSWHNQFVVQKNMVTIYPTNTRFYSPQALEYVSQLCSRRDKLSAIELCSDTSCANWLHGKHARMYYLFY